MERGDDLTLFVLLKKLLVAFLFLECRKVKPLLERFEVIENVGQEKVEEGPKLREIVLEWSSGEKKTVRRSVRFELSNELAVEVLEAMTLVLSSC